MSDSATPRRVPAVKPVQRRAFLRTSLIAGTLGSLGAFSAGALGFMWPTLGEGFGAAITVGKPEDIAAEIRAARTPYAFPAGRLYVVLYDPRVPGAEETYAADHPVRVGNDGLMALYQRCVHLGCRVPWCLSSQWFECPCHGSKYNRWGEWMEGPAPRGLDRFPSLVDDDGNFVVNTGVVLTGPARTGRVLEQQPEGANCIDL